MHTASPDLRPALRLEVARFRAGQVRRVFDPAVHVGRPGGDRTSFVLPASDSPATDDALRIEIATDLVAATADGPGEPAHAWVTRPGLPELHDLDLRWLFAMRVAFGVHGRRLSGFYALTRTGWLDVVTGESRVWKRLRL